MRLHVFQYVTVFEKPIRIARQLTLIPTALCGGWEKGREKGLIAVADQ